MPNNNNKQGTQATQQPKKVRVRQAAAKAARMAYNKEFLPGSMPSADPGARPIFKRPSSDAGRRWLLYHLNPNGNHNLTMSPQGRITDGTMKRTGIFNVHGTLPITNPFLIEPTQVQGVILAPTDETGEGSYKGTIRPIYPVGGSGEQTQAAGENQGNTWSVFIISTNTIFLSHLLVAARGSKDSVPDAVMGKIIGQVNGGSVLDEKINVWNEVPGQPDWRFALHSENEFKEYLKTQTDFENLPTSDFLYMRQTYKGDTYRFSGSTLNNEGTVSAASFPTIVDSGIIPFNFELVKDEEEERDTTDAGRHLDIGLPANTRDTSIVPYPYTSFIRSTFVQLPLLDVNQIMLADQKAYQGRAEHGCYTINFNTDSNFRWHPTSEYRCVHITQSMAPTLTRGDFGFNAFRDIIMPEYDTKVVMFVGIDRTATLAMEYRRGIEYHSSPSGRYQSLQDSAPEFDPIPMMAAKCVVMNMPSGFPAAYNDFGLLGNILGSILPGVVSQVPVIGGMLAPKVGGLIHGLFGGNNSKQKGDPTVEKLLNLLKQLVTNL